jgi:hypothetical protein
MRSHFLISFIFPAKLSGKKENNGKEKRIKPDNGRAGASACRPATKGEKK